jgi:REP element-mobilizing transposase RayT
MSRKLRYMDRPVVTFEVTTRTLQGRLLLKPSAELNEIILGILGRALELYPVLLHLVVVASNHIHLIVTAESVKQLSDFMQYFNSNIAREAGRLHRWREKFWGRRYTSISIEDDDKLIERAAYLLSHGCKEGLVLRPQDWPGVNCVEALTRGKTLSGVWYDRTKEYEAEQARQEWSSADFATKYTVPLSPLPCFADLDDGHQRARYRAMVQDIVLQTRERFVRAGRRVMGAKRVKAQAPHHRPRKIKQSPAPACHCSNPEQYRKYRDNYRWFVGLYQDASRLLRAGDQKVRFPDNCFPPALAFTGADPPGKP